MLLKSDNHVIETSGDMKEALFSIGDLSVVFDILRNKMYSDPIRAICREISCNARDSHREVGKFDEPVEITLPNGFEPFWKCKDFGPGISPERIEDVFIRYGVSTKRNDNIQTGAYGMGCKTPFSYSDTFNIETVVDGIKYSYTCLIDETKVGKLALMNRVATDAPNGTEIIIKVKNQDFQKFIKDTEYVTRHWTVRPVIKGSSLVYQDITKSMVGKDYVISKQHNNDYNREVKLIVDGIEYPCDLTQLKGYANTSVIDAVTGAIYLYFRVGELSLSATREAVHLDQNTQSKINDKLGEIVNDLGASIKQKIAASKSLWDANVYVANEVKKTFSDIKFLGQLDWQGIPVTGNEIRINDAVVYAFTKGKRERGTVNPNKIARTTQSYINFLENSELYMCDLALKEPQVKNVSKAFADNPSLKYLFVIKPNNGITVDVLNKIHNFDKMGIKNISSITKIGRTYTISGVRLLIFKYDKVYGCFKQISYAGMEEDDNEKVICSLNRNKYSNAREVILKNKKTLSNDIIKSLITSNPTFSIYGVDTAIPTDKLEEHFSDFEPIDDFIEDKVFKNTAIDFTKVKYACENQYNVDRSIVHMAPLIAQFDDPDSLYLHTVKLHAEIRELVDKYKGTLMLYELTKGDIDRKSIDTFLKKNPDFNVKEVQEKVAKQYPLLACLDYYSSSRALDPIVHYINLVDKELKNSGKI